MARAIFLQQERNEDTMLMTTCVLLYVGIHYSCDSNTPTTHMRAGVQAKQAALLEARSMCSVVYLNICVTCIIYKSIRNTQNRFAWQSPLYLLIQFFLFFLSRNTHTLRKHGKICIRRKHERIQVSSARKRKMENTKIYYFIISMYSIYIIPFSWFLSVSWANRMNVHK